MSDPDGLSLGWIKAALKEALTFSYGKGLPQRSRNACGSIPVYGSSGQIGTHSVPLVDHPTLVVGRKGSVGNVHLSRDPSYPIDTVFYSDRNEHVDLRFFEYHLKFIELGQLDKSTTIPSLSRDHLHDVPVCCPPRLEQSRIVEAIEEQFTRLDAGVAALKRVETNLRRYKAAVLKAACEGRLTEKWRQEHPDVEPASELLKRILKERRRRWEEAELARMIAKGKPPKDEKWKQRYGQPAEPDSSLLPRLPGNWCWATMEQLVFYLRNGLAKKPSQVPPGHRILRINAVRPMAVDLAEVRYYDQPFDDVADYFLDNGDLLFTRYNGSVDLLGVVGMVRGLHDPTLHPDKLIRAKTVMAYPVPQYVEIASNVGASRAHMRSRARTTAGQTGISGGDILTMPIPLCPLDEQARIVLLVEEHMSLVIGSENLAGAGLRRSSRLRQSILKRAFEGKLVPQDPNDEPASVLLERIRAERARTPAPRASSKGRASIKRRGRRAPVK